MRNVIIKFLLMLAFVAAGLIWNSDIRLTSEGSFISISEARVGRPATPVSYAGVARRSTVGVGAPGVGARPANRGGPVNRVGRR